MVRSSGWYGLAGALVVTLVCGLAMGQENRLPPTVLLGKPVEKAGQQGLLGDLFESRAAGISFRAPADTHEVRKQGIPDLIVEYINEEQQTLLRATTLELKEDRKLDAFKDSKGKAQKGLVDESVESFQQQYPTCEVLRHEVKKVHDLEMGLMAFRFTQGPARRLLQQVLIPLTDRNYYLLTLITPGAKAGATGVDAREKIAADTFAEMIETIKLIDRREIVKEQNQRLVSTKQMLASLRVPKLMEKAIVPEQWLRLTRDGKDIGYSYVTEEKTKEDGREGVLVSVRSRTVPSPQQQVDVSSRMFISKEWMHESWSHVANSVANGKPDEAVELGLSDQATHYQVDPQPDILSRPATEENKNKQPEVHELLRYNLQVRTRALPKPVEHELPEWYLPQAIRHLLPRMLPLDKKQGYMFVSYVSEYSQPMTRYIDVGEVRDLDLDGRTIKVIPVQDRVGLEGVPTTYFVTLDGKYMGSETVYKMEGHDSVIRVLPSDEATLMKLWKNAQLQKPQQSEVPQMPMKKK